MCAHANRMQSQGAAREDTTAGERDVHVHFKALLYRFEDKLKRPKKMMQNSLVHQEHTGAVAE